MHLLILEIGGGKGGWGKVTMEREGFNAWNRNLVRATRFNPLF